MNELTTVKPRAAIVVQDPIPVLDTGRFEQMQRIATAMAIGTLVPESLCREGGKHDGAMLPVEAIRANCFAVVNQAVRWGMDPFAVVQCASVVRGKLVFEGKLVAAVLRAKLGVRLNYEYDEGRGPKQGITVWGMLDGDRLEIHGTVEDWSTGEKGAWGRASNWRRMLAYRGTREWARLYAPDVLLGVYTDDELEDMAEEARARRATLIAPPPPAEEVAKIAAEPPGPIVETAPAPEKPKRGRPRKVEAPPPPEPEPEQPIEDVITAPEPQVDVILLEDEPEADEEPADWLLELARQKSLQGANSLRFWKAKLPADSVNRLAPHWPGLEEAARRADERNLSPDWRNNL